MKLHGGKWVFKSFMSCMRCMLIWKAILDDLIVITLYILQAFRRNALTMNTKFCICLVIFKGTEDTFVINLPSKYQIIALSRCVSR